MSGRSQLRRIRVGGRTLTVTEVFDSYWKFATERQNVFFRRLAGSPAPWTNDLTIGSYRFTNVYRASDRVSQYLIRNVIYEGDSRPEEVVFRTLLFKIFNRISTWENLRAIVGPILWSDFSFDRYNVALDQLFAASDRIYSAAYIMPSPPFGERRKHSNHLRLLEKMMRNGFTHRLREARSLHDVFNLLKSFPSLGNFLAFQLAIDLNYSEVIDHDEMSFVVAGPGARDGIAKCFSDTGGLSEAEVIRVVCEVAESEFNRLGLQFRDLWGRPLQLIDCQNIFCEVSKYARAVHPDALGSSGRTRIKQKYRPAVGPLPQYYPQKWKLTLPAPKLMAETRRLARPPQRTLWSIET